MVLHSHIGLNIVGLAIVLVSVLQTTKLDRDQGQELCDEIANMLLNMIESQDVDNKVDAAINVFLTKQNVNTDAAELARKLSWSVKVRLEA